MNLHEYRREVRRTTSKDISFAEALCVAGLGLTGEAGEAADLIKKHVFHGHDLDRDKLIKEMGDVLWYLTFLGNALDIPLSAVMDVNVAKLHARYPDGWDKQRSINREREE